MTKKLARLLRADIQETSDLKSIAAMLAGKGRGGDTMLAHITPREVSLLKEAGGAGTVNPDTGLLEFYDWTGTGGITDYGSSYQSAPASSGGYYDSLPAATPGVYGKDASSDYYQIAPETFAPAIDYASQSGYGPASVGSAGAFDAVGQAFEEFPPGMASSLSVGGGQLPTPPAGAVAAAQERQALIGKGAPAGAAEKPFLSNEQMVRLGLTGGLGVYGALQQRKAAEQMKKATAETKALARPYQEEGRRLIEAAKGGELTPAAAQQYQALQAQLAQGASQRGGIGVAQAAAQAEAFKNQLLQGQYDAGLKVSSIGDNIALGAIRTGMQLDQQLTQANIGFYTQLGALAAGVPTYRNQ
jgi:hypothetical protein